MNEPLHTYCRSKRNRQISLRGVLEGQGVIVGHIVDADMISKTNHLNVIQAGRQAIAEMEDCLQKNISFTQETTLSGKGVERTLRQARAQGYYVSLFYVGLNSAEESLMRIQNRVRKGGHDIPKEDVLRRFNGRVEALTKILPDCDEVTFYDNENGFVKVAEMRNNRFSYSNACHPLWMEQIYDFLQGI